MRGEDLRGLRAFGEDYPEARRALLYGGKDTLLVDGIACAPVADFLRQVRPHADLPFVK